MSVAPPPAPMNIDKGYRWNARHNAIGKWYSYRMSTVNTLNPQDCLYRAHVYQPLSMDLFLATLLMFVGRHDFRNYGNRLEHHHHPQELVNTIRTIKSIELIEEGWGKYRVDILLDGALYRMVRNIVGTALLVGRGALDLDEAKRALEAPCDVGKRPIRSAPARGLTLEHVYYDDY